MCIYLNEERPAIGSVILKCIFVLALGYSLGYAHHFMSDKKYHETVKAETELFVKEVSAGRVEVISQDEYVQARIRHAVREVLVYPERNRELINESLEGLEGERGG